MTDQTEKPRAEHTPTPWHVRKAERHSDGGTDYGIIAIIEGKPVIIGEAFEVVDEDNKVNSLVHAHLFKAAPMLVEALEGLLKNYDIERAVIDVDPEPSCIECTAGTTPNHLNKGPCAYHKAIAALVAARGETEPDTEEKKS